MATDQAEARQWFNFIDSDKDGLVSAPELQRALSKGGLHYSLQTIANMIRAFDTSDKSAVEFSEFYELHIFITFTQRSFTSMLPAGATRLPHAHVSRALQQAGFALDPQAFDALFKAYDPTHAAALDMAEYLALTFFLKAASGMFHVFDNRRAGSITLDFNQFVYACTFCR